MEAIGLNPDANPLCNPSEIDEDFVDAMFDFSYLNNNTFAVFIIDKVAVVVDVTSREYVYLLGKSNCLLGSKSECLSIGARAVNLLG